jgi:hypothetical protein
MSMLFSRKAIIPTSFVVFGLFALFRLPMTFETGALLLLGAVIAPAILLSLLRKPSPTIAEVLHDTEASKTK